jgi:hypothetical protein
MFLLICATVSDGLVRVVARSVIEVHGSIFTITCTKESIIANF